MRIGMRPTIFTGGMAAALVPACGREHPARGSEHAQVFLGYPKITVQQRRREDTTLTEWHMPDGRSRLCLVGPDIEELRLRFAAMIGREPTSTELKIFARWRVAVALDVPQRPPRGRHDCS